MYLQKYGPSTCKGADAGAHVDAHAHADADTD